MAESDCAIHSLRYSGDSRIGLMSASNRLRSPLNPPLWSPLRPGSSSVSSAVSRTSPAGNRTLDEFDRCQRIVNLDHQTLEVVVFELDHDRVVTTVDIPKNQLTVLMKRAGGDDAGHVAAGATPAL